MRRIATRAFVSNNTIRGINLASSVTTLAANAFYGTAPNCAITLHHFKLPTFGSSWAYGIQSGQFNVYVPTAAYKDEVSTNSYFRTFVPANIYVSTSGFYEISCG